MNKTPWDVLRALYTNETSAGFELVRNAETGEWLAKAWIAGHSYGWSNRKLVERTFRADEFGEIASWLASEALASETLARKDTTDPVVGTRENFEHRRWTRTHWEDSIDSRRSEDS